jgi:hypothetical protein
MSSSRFATCRGAERGMGGRERTGGINGMRGEAHTRLAGAGAGAHRLAGAMGRAAPTAGGSGAAPGRTSGVCTGAVWCERVGGCGERSAHQAEDRLGGEGELARPHGGGGGGDDGAVRRERPHNGASAAAGGSWGVGRVSRVPRERLRHGGSGRRAASDGSGTHGREREGHTCGAGAGGRAAGPDGRGGEGVAGEGVEEADEEAGHVGRDDPQVLGAGAGAQSTICSIPSSIHAPACQPFDISFHRPMISSQFVYTKKRSDCRPRPKGCQRDLERPL